MPASLRVYLPQFWPRRSAIVTQLEANLQEEEAALQKLKGLAAGVNMEPLIAEEDEQAK